jgi:GntR family transcriptional repressor for pyruvate dehydrogenase complex
VFYNRQMMFKRRVTRGEILEQHRAINTALQARDPEASRAAVEVHMEYIETALQDLKISERNETIAQQRYEHEQERG